MHGDALTAPFWQGAEAGELRLQRCRDCGGYQHYPRPFCTHCDSEDLDWVTASGRGAIYSVTTVRIPVLEELEPPYQVALVSLEEGPRVLANLVGPECQIGDRVTLAWRERADAPPMPVFERKGP